MEQQTEGTRTPVLDVVILTPTQRGCQTLRKQQATANAARRCRFPPPLPAVTKTRSVKDELIRHLHLLQVGMNAPYVSRAAMLLKQIARSKVSACMAGDGGQA